jgi:hypothetical protein
MSPKTNKRAENYLRLFIVECPGPADATEGIAESSAVAAIARLIGHAVHSIPVHSIRALKEACTYIGSITQVRGTDLKRPLCLHISAHGASDGLLFGRTLDWSKLLEVIQPVLTYKYKGPRILILSSCEADQQQLTKKIKSAVQQDTSLIPPRFIFCARGSVSWPNAAVGWTLLYHLIPNVNLDDKEQVKKMLAKIKEVGAASFTYFRWDDKSKSYKRHPPANGG